MISAPSGAGKTTLCQKLLKDFPDLVLSISSTTRAPRGREKNGVDYHFLTREEFQKLIHENRFAEWAQVHENYYGTSKSVIEEALRTHRSVLLDIDVQGAQSIQQAFADQSLLIFIAPPSLEVLEQRLMARGTDTREVIQKRMRRAQAEMEHQKRFAHIIINEDLERAYAELKTIVAKALT